MVQHTVYYQYENKYNIKIQYNINIKYIIKYLYNKLETHTLSPVRIVFHIKWLIIELKI